SIELVRVPSLDLYREPDPFRTPHLREFRDGVDALEFATMLTGGFPEPRTFSLRVARLLRERVRAGQSFDIVHDNQTLGDGLLDIQRHLPLVTTIHHPISQDRRTDLAAARGWRRWSLRRWYGFVRMQARVSRRLQHLLTVSASSARDIVADFGVDPHALQVVPLGVDTHMFAPDACPSGRVPGRLVAMASADTPLKGVDTLLRALVGLLQVPELVLVTTPGDRTRRLIAELALGDRVRFVSGVTDAELAALLASAEIVCVPSRYEGFSLPAVEAMACGTPVVASRAGALPEVLGEDGSAARLVPPGDAQALRTAIARLLADPAERRRMGRAGRERAVQRYDWAAVAVATTAAYRAAIASHPQQAGGPQIARSNPCTRPDDRIPLHAHR
ncbi:MAG: glycosyltransferase family 4 protein, partial [Micrococcales bacterium]|nr:glycosyltransferase family 4 protein [Micrococcales bacterium]